jgi:hypothetical protein
MKRYLLTPQDFTDDVRQVGAPTSSDGQVRNEGKYDCLAYRHIGYPKVARNAMEMNIPGGAHVNEANPIAERILRPRTLMFLREEGTFAFRMNVDEWVAQYKSQQDLKYVFVAYTAEQFETEDDLRALHQIADAAARNAGVIAYWVGCSCMDPDDLQEDVRITPGLCMLW